ncbi:hypothetical protein H5V45_11175 [Nocardioides sp. KIGAM211]|uniref:Uncharacterized protein n=1 Tax=Nocardioides luti TaxID=2761101 RepID=A0A7X0RGI0_9ACTN|nr:hypothetical protein [Nocardioides luti]MBB6627879.1 hypothetical protein [Nocardioides luti]
MEPETTLPPRHLLAWASLGLAAFFSYPLVQVVRAGQRGEMPALAAAGIAALIALLFVIGPLWAAQHLLRLRIAVSREHLTTYLGGRLHHRLALAELTEVRPVVDGSVGALTPEAWNPAVWLIGPDQHGRRRALKITLQRVTTMAPLLEALRPVVAARPDLVRDEPARKLLAEYLSDPR